MNKLTHARKPYPGATPTDTVVSVSQHGRLHPQLHTQQLSPRFWSIYLTVYCYMHRHAMHFSINASRHTNTLSIAYAIPHNVLPHARLVSFLSVLFFSVHSVACAAYAVDAITYNPLIGDQFTDK